MENKQNKGGGLNKSLKLRVCQVFCVSFKKKIYGEGNLPLCIVSNFIRLLY